MGSLEAGIQSKRDNFPRSYSGGRSDRYPFLQRPRSQVLKYFFSKKLDYRRWICTLVVFLFFIVFQMFLTGLVVEKYERSSRSTEKLPSDLVYLKKIGGLDFGEDIRFEPSKLLQKFRKDAQIEDSTSAFNGTRKRFGYRKPRLAVVFADLLVEPQQVLMVTVISALREIGYAVEIFTLGGGPVLDIWQKIGIPTTILKINSPEGSFDWLNYEAVLVNSLESRSIISSLMQEPFKSLPLIWIVNEESLATVSRNYNSTRQIELFNDWKKLFNHATVVVFPNHFLAMSYSAFDFGNFYVIPGLPSGVSKVKNQVVPQKNDTDIIVVIVGSQFLYRGLWLEHALVLKALFPLYENEANSHLKILVLGGDSTGNYSMAVEAIALNLMYPKGLVKYVVADGYANEILSRADVVVYGSFLEEQYFPDILVNAMFFEKPIIVPDLPNIKKYVDDRVNGFLFSKENIKALTDVSLEVLSDGKVSSVARNVASIGQNTAKNLMVREIVESYAMLVGSVIKIPSEVASPKTLMDAPKKLIEEWQWHLFEPLSNFESVNRTEKVYKFLRKLEDEWNRTASVTSVYSVMNDDSFVYEIWQEEKILQNAYTRKRREEEELKDRSDQFHGKWEDVYKTAKRATRLKNDLHERDEGELERAGQPLCIYEPYLGEGTWPFLHNKSLYRGIDLSTKGRRRGTDDIEAPSRLPLLSNLYFRETLGEYGAFFAIANRIDRVHKNAWIGFQSWRATARKASLSKTAEQAILNDIQARKHGDALYFWVRMDEDPRNPAQKDFWSFCDSINAGNCRLAFNESLTRMYGVKHLESLPVMPGNGGTWSVMHSWALPTRSFVEFVMFSRMFVDSLDAKMYHEHRRTGECYLSLTKDKQCYLRLLELLINVWAYHSARHLVYVNPDSGMIQEQHKLKTRRGKMWIKWFQYSTLKAMDEDLAEVADSDRPSGHWLWPSTGEIFWHGTVEKERRHINEEKERKKQKSRRIKARSGRQKVIGKYVKPPPDGKETSNTTTAAAAA